MDEFLQSIREIKLLEILKKNSRDIKEREIWTKRQSYLRANVLKEIELVKNKILLAHTEQEELEKLLKEIENV